jgi:hypothetical protein
MKRRLHKIANFFAFNLLFFALYLNFIHRDKTAVNTSNNKTTAFGQTVIIEANNTAKNNTAIMPVQQASAANLQSNTEPLRLSIN